MIRRPVVFFVTSWLTSGRINPKPRPLSIVTALLHGLAPVAMLDIPLHGRAEAFLEAVARRPAELPPDLVRVNGVSTVVAGAIGHKRLQRPVAGAVHSGIGR